MELQYEPPKTQRLPNEPFNFTNKTLNSAHRMYLYVRKTNKMHTFSFSDLIQLYCLRPVSENQLFIIGRLYKQRYGISSCIYIRSLVTQDVFGIKQTLAVTRLLICLISNIT
jgi:hypothetical protein